MGNRYGDVPLRCRAVAAAIIAGTGTSARVLALRRAGDVAGGAWGLVTGSIEPGETATEAIIREIAEETGIQVTDLFTCGLTETFYFAPDNVMELMPIFVAFVPQEVPVVLDHGSDAFEWCSRDRASALFSFAGQRRAIGDIWHDFVDCTPADFRKVM
ncbi:NUDIX hydrolase [Dongia rigui]|uniref:NUDIX domain-containing protein n=1 Tax=Dongia rigui TaxID=940149 RepID=A0ABU5DZB6_9PROT|nr:NUDIX domain-containing protein [Dongia rigui]MDY0872270.1 NUDIX domain-containing protein [Dongia rigui]